MRPVFNNTLTSLKISAKIFSSTTGLKTMITTMISPNLNARALGIADGSWKRPSSTDTMNISRPNTRAFSSSSTHNQESSSMTDSEFCVQEERWLSKARQAQIIISNSIETQLMEQSLEFMRRMDPAGLWELLQQMDPNKDPTNCCKNLSS